MESFTFSVFCRSATSEKEPNPIMRDMELVTNSHPFSRNKVRAMTAIKFHVVVVIPTIVTLVFIYVMVSFFAGIT